MTPNPLLVVAGIAYGVAGLALTFAPHELLPYVGVTASPATAWLGQLLGAALFALAFLNWFLRFTQMAGIHGRPLLVTNLSFSTIAFLASLRHWREGGTSVVAGATVVLGALAIGFGARLLRPGRPATSAPTTAGASGARGPDRT